MLLTNYAIRNANQSRALGGNLDPTYNFNLAKMNTFYAQDSSSLAPFQTNLLPNGNFEFSVHEYTGSYTWLNGTRLGTSNPYVGYGWFNYNFAGTRTAAIVTDEKRSGSSSLKISLSGVGSSMNFGNTITFQYPYNLIPVLPNTQYTISGWIKTSLISGSATTGARIRHNQLNSAFGSVAASNIVSGIVTTTDWTQYTTTITTNPSAAFMNIELGLTGNDGANTLIMDAWFDDISVTLTNQVTRADTDNNNQFASQPSFGLQPPYALVLPPKAGGMSMWSGGTGTVSNAAQVAGLFASATLAGLGIISNGAMGLTVEMVASIANTGTLSASVIGQLQAVASLSGSSSVTAAQSALAGMLASLAGTGVISDAQQEALGQMIANIYVNESQATVDQIVDGVVDSLGSITATVPNLLNTETGDVIIPLD